MLSHWLLVVAASTIVTPPSSIEAGEGSPPRLSGEAPARQVVREGTRVHRVNCPVDGDKPILIEWKKDGERIDDITWTRYKVGNGGKTLRIKNVHPDDAGTFTCEAVNGFGRLLVNIKLVVYGSDAEKPSSFEQIPEGTDHSGPNWLHPDRMSGFRSATPMVRQIGGSARLECLVDGKPVPTVFWTKDGVALPSDWRQQQEAQVVELAELSEADSGRYMCTAYNDYGAINATFVLLVSDSPAREPEFDPSHPLNQTVAVGQAATFQCKVYSQVKPLIKWVKRVDTANGQRSSTNNKTFTAEGMDLMMLDQDAAETIHGQDDVYLNRLTIKNVQPHHEGWYICVVTSTAGHVVFRKAHLNVLSVLVAVAQDESVPLHLILGVPLAVLVLIAVIYGIFIVMKNKQKPTTVTIHNNRAVQPPPPQMPPPSLPGYKCSPSPHTAVTNTNYYYHQQQQPNQDRAGYMPHGTTYRHNDLLQPTSNGYHQFDPCSLPLKYGSPTTADTHMSNHDNARWSANQHDRFLDYDENYPEGRLQPYPSMYSCT